MKTIIKGVYVVIIIILSSVISILTSMVINEITKKQDLKNAHEAFFAGMTDSEKNSAVLLLVRKHEEESVKKSTANVSGNAEMQFSIQNKIQDGATTQTLSFMMPDEVISLSMPSARLMPEIDMSEAPEEKVSVRDVFYSVVKKLMNSFETGAGLPKETEKIKPELAKELEPVKNIIEEEPSADVSSAAAVEIAEKPEIRITLPTGKEAWVGRKFKAEDGNCYIMDSPSAAQQVDCAAKPMYDGKTGEYVGWTIVKGQTLPPTVPVVAKATVESEKAPVIAKSTTTKEVNFVPKPETVYVHDQNQKYTLTIRDVGGLMKFPKDVYPNGIQPFYYGKFPRVVLRATVTTDITIEEKYLIFFTRKLVKKVVLLDSVEVFSGGTWYWYLTNDKESGMKMVRTSDLSKMHPIEK